MIKFICKVKLLYRICYEFGKNLKISRLFDEYSAVLSENQKLVMIEYYFEDKTLSEIAQNLSISRQAVLDTIKKSEDKLLEFEDKFKLVEKVEGLQEIINKFKTNQISKHQFVDEIENKIKEI